VASTFHPISHILQVNPHFCLTFVIRRAIVFISEVAVKNEYLHDKVKLYSIEVISKWSGVTVQKCEEEYTLQTLVTCLRSIPSEYIVLVEEIKS
jgi:hypothetical protein